MTEFQEIRELLFLQREETKALREEVKRMNDVIKQLVPNEYKLKEAAKVLGCCVNTVRNYISNGDLVCNQAKAGRGCKITIDSAELFAFKKKIANRHLKAA